MPVVNDEQLAFALDATAYDGSWQIYLALFPNVRAMYRFATLRMWMTAEEKAQAARQLLRRYPRARANALVGLADADVDHQVTRDATLDHYPKPLRPQPFEPLGQGIRLSGGHAHPKNPGELSGQPGHPALHPVATVLLDDGRNQLDQPRPILPEHSNNETLHEGQAPYP
jgi:hypothetical protein